MADEKPKSLYRDRSNPSQRRRRRRTSSQRTEGSRGSSYDSTHRSRRHSTRGQPESPWARRIVWISLALVLVAYVGLLGLTTVKKWMRSRTPPAAEAEPLAETEAEPIEESAWPAAAELHEHVENWQRSERTIAELQKIVAESSRAAEVETRLNRALEFSPNHTLLKVKLAQNLLLQKRFPDAARVAFEALDADPDNEDARVTLAKALAGGKRHEATLVIANWLIKNDPIDMLGHRLAMEAYLATGKPAAAIEHINRVLSVDRENFALLNKLAGAHSDLGQHERAIAVLQRAAKEDQNSGVALFNLACSYARIGDLDNMLRTLDQASQELGLSFVATWLQSKDFDPVRDDPRFQEFLGLAEQLLSPGPLAQPAGEEEPL